MTLWRHRDAWAWPCSGHSHDALGSAPGFCSMGPAKRLLQGLRRQLCNPWQGCVSEVCTSSEALGIYHVIRLFFQNMNIWKTMEVYWTASRNVMGMFHMHAAVSPAQQGAWHGHRSMSTNRSYVYLIVQHFRATSFDHEEGRPAFAHRTELETRPIMQAAQVAGMDVSKHMVVSRPTYICGSS